MKPVSIATASKLTGKSIPTLYRHIKSGKLSAHPGDRGQERKLDVSELIRVYGEFVGVPDGDDNQKEKVDNQVIGRENHHKGLNGERQRYEERIQDLHEQIIFLRSEMLEMRKHQEKMMDNESKFLEIINQKLLPPPEKLPPESTVSAAWLLKEKKTKGKKSKGKKGKKGKR